MKIRSVVTLVGLAICFALPTFAQQKDAADPPVVQQRQRMDPQTYSIQNHRVRARWAAVSVHRTLPSTENRAMRRLRFTNMFESSLCSASRSSDLAAHP
jgi:hypothetical protein